MLLGRWLLIWGIFHRFLVKRWVVSWSFGTSTGYWSSQTHQPVHLVTTLYIYMRYIWYLVSVTMVTIWMAFFTYEWTNIIVDDGWVHPAAKTLSSLVRNWLWNIVMDDWKLDEKSLDKWQQLQHCKFIIHPRKFNKIKWRGMTNNVGFTLSVGETTPRFTISVEQVN